MKNKNNPLVSSLVFILLALAFVSVQPAQAQSGARTFYVSVDGAKQGIFKGDPPKSKIQGSGISYEVKPGQAGRPQAQSLVITREASGASLQFFAAVFTNEVLKSVILDFYRVSANGTEEVYQSIKLTNVTISHIKQYTRQIDQQKSQAPLLEDITLAFQHVEISAAGKMVASDDLK